MNVVKSKRDPVPRLSHTLYSAGRFG